MQTNATPAYRNFYFLPQQKQKPEGRSEATVAMWSGRKHNRVRKKKWRCLIRERRGKRKLQLKLLPRRASRTKEKMRKQLNSQRPARRQVARNQSTRSTLSSLQGKMSQMKTSNHPRRSLSSRQRQSKPIRKRPPLREDLLGARTFTNHLMKKRRTGRKQKTSLAHQQREARGRRERLPLLRLRRSRRQRNSLERGEWMDIEYVRSRLLFVCILAWRGKYHSFRLSVFRAVGS